MGRPKGSKNKPVVGAKGKNKKTTTIKEEIKTHECTKCGKIKKRTDFYLSYNPIYQFNGIQPICKECLCDIYDEFYINCRDEKLAIFRMCQTLGIYFDTVNFTCAKEQSEKQGYNLARIYMQKINSMTQNIGKWFFDSEELFKNVVNIDVVNKPSDFEVTPQLIHKWGRGLTDDDYEFLEAEYMTWISRYECESYSQELLFQNIAHQSLDIRKKREQGEDVNKELKTLQDLLGTANIKPVQETGANASEQSSFGTLLKKYENERPTPNDMDEWEDWDWIKKYVNVWFFGCLCSMMGIHNKYSKEYEEEIGKYTVEPDSEEDDDFDIAEFAEINSDIDDGDEDGS